MALSWAVRMKALCAEQGPRAGVWGGRGEARKRLVSEHVERLVQAGASLAWRTDDVRGSSVTLYDPEGNEFCVT